MWHFNEIVGFMCSLSLFRLFSILPKRDSFRTLNFFFISTTSTVFVTGGEKWCHYINVRNTKKLLSHNRKATHPHKLMLYIC